jgi:hypothetical protein
LGITVDSQEQEMKGLRQQTRMTMMAAAAAAVAVAVVVVVVVVVVYNTVSVYVNTWGYRLLTSTKNMYLKG